MRVTVIPHAELEAIAREEYRRHFDRAPKPRTINQDALVAFSAPPSRVIEWRSVRYHAPPLLPFPVAVRLLAVAHVLGDLRDRKFLPVVLDRACGPAHALLASLLQPISRIRRALPRRNPFRGMPYTETLAALHGLLYVPDDGSAQVPATAPVTVDMIDNIAMFVRELPAWCGRDGLPLSWPHYVYGMRHLARVVAREDLRIAAAVRTGHWADEKGWRMYEGELKTAAGWVH